MLLNGPPGTIFSEIWIENTTIFTKQNSLENSSLKRCSFYLGQNVLTECPPFCIMHFIERNSLWFDSNFSEVCSLGFNWQRVIIGSRNGSALNKRRSITQTNVLRALIANASKYVLWSYPGSYEASVVGESAIGLQNYANYAATFNSLNPGDAYICDVIHRQWFNSSPPDKMAAISQTTF